MMGKGIFLSPYRTHTGLTAVHGRHLGGPVAWAGIMYVEWHNSIFHFLISELENTTAFYHISLFECQMFLFMVR